MSCVSKLTDEEVKYNSILETQKSLIELGAIQEKESHQNKLKETRYKFLENEIATNMTLNILPIKINDILSKRIYNERSTELLNLFEIYNEFFVYNKELVSNLEKLTIRLEDDYNCLRIENNETNKEYDTKQKYWESRVTKLRDKCMTRNKKIAELENKELYNIYNITIKNICLILMCIFNFDITEFIYNYLMFILLIVGFSFYTNGKIIYMYNKAKTD